MKTAEEIKREIAKIEAASHHVLTGSRATLRINAPRALMQLEAETKLQALHWVLGKKYNTKLKGIDT